MTREEIDKMGSKQLVENLTAHGLNINPYVEKPVTELRELLKSIVFVNL